jgi:hypothetical protein
MFRESGLSDIENRSVSIDHGRPAGMKTRIVQTLMKFSGGQLDLAIQVRRKGRSEEPFRARRS